MRRDAATITGCNQISGEASLPPRELSLFPETVNRLIGGNLVIGQVHEVYLRSACRKVASILLGNLFNLYYTFQLINDFSW